MSSELSSLELYRQHRDELDIITDDAALFVLMLINEFTIIKLAQLRGHLKLELDNLIEVLNKLESLSTIKIGDVTDPYTPIRILTKGKDVIEFFDKATAQLLKADWRIRISHVERSFIYPLYELLFIAAPSIAQEELDFIITDLCDTVINQGGKVAKVDLMGRRKLAYPIGTCTEGHYVIMTVAGTKGVIAATENRMRYDDSIIRYITIRIEESFEHIKASRTRRTAEDAIGIGAGNKSTSTKTESEDN